MLDQLLIRQVLLLLVAVGLLASPGVRRPGHVRDGQAQTWRDVRHGLPAVAADAPTEVVLSARPVDDGIPRTTKDGGAPPHGAPSAHGLVVPTLHRTLGRPAAAHDDRILLAQPHRRVNGSANAFGAQA